MTLMVTEKLNSLMGWLLSSAQPSFSPSSSGANKPMKTSVAGALEILEHEGAALGPYFDSVGVLTWGIGHTKAAGGIDPAAIPREDTRTWGENRVAETLSKIFKQFQEDLRTYEARVNQAIRVPLKQHQFDALVSFDLNTGGIHRAQLTRAINAGDPRASEHFFGWLRPPELRGRRTKEKNLFDTGDYTSNGSSFILYDVTVEGRLRVRGSRNTGLFSHLL